MRLGINGFGRIGRCFLRSALQRDDIEFDIVAVNDLADADTLAHLLKYDTTFGELDEEVKAEDGTLVAGDMEVELLSEKDPTALPWDEKDVDLAVEATGLFRKREDAKMHLEAGADKTLVTAPGKGEGSDIIVIQGVNDDEYDPDEHEILDIGSCTTNCLVPTVNVLLEKFGIEKALMTTTHSYTTSQNILDGLHSDLRRARAAAANILPTTTGAAIATTEVLPELEGKLHGMALRVPTIDASVVDLVALLGEDVTEDEVNSAYEEVSNGAMEGILDYTETPLVSSDYIGNPHSATVDGEFTKIRAGNLVKVISWYDNEWGFSNRLIDTANQISRMG